MTTDTLELPEPWSHLRYDPYTGAFTWTTGRGHVKAGASAGSKLGGYWSIRIGGKTYLAHRVAVLLMTGKWPDDGLTVDHIDGDKLNNRWSNLRVVAMAINNQNIRRGRGRSGLIGAHWNEQEGKWQAGIRVNGRKVHLGRFSTPEEAHEAYVNAKREHHAGCTI